MIIYDTLKAYTNCLIKQKSPGASGTFYLIKNDSKLCYLSLTFLLFFFLKLKKGCIHFFERNFLELVLFFEFRSLPPERELLKLSLLLSGSAFISFPKSLLYSSSASF